jgi:hypothetical protein
METGEVKVDVEGDVIVASLPGTAYRALFTVPHDERRLIQSKMMSVDRAASISHKEFEALAWTAANAKARELGWID